MKVIERVIVLFVLSLVLLVTACTPQAQAVMVTATPGPTATASPGVMVHYEGYAQFELIGASGRRILIDVYDPELLTSPPTEDDILLTTHLHGDHFLAEFADSFPGVQIRNQEGRIVLPGVSIQSIASAHSADEALMSAGGSNYILIIDLDGLRLVHFGDIGQLALTQNQLEVLGEVDVAMLLFGGMCSVTPMGSFGLMEQVQPRLIIPTHAAEEELAHAIDLWDAYYADPWDDHHYRETAGVLISRAALSEETRFLVLGEWASSCRDSHDLPTW